MTLECGNEVWLNKYVDPTTTNTTTFREVINPLPYIIGEVWTSYVEVQLKDVAIGGESILVNIRVAEHTYGVTQPCGFVYSQDIIIQRGSYEEFSTSNGSYLPPECPKHSGDDLDTSWRVYCDSTLYNTDDPGLSKASVRLCDGAGGDSPDPGGDPGMGGDGDGSSYLIVQYFTTESFGWSGGCVLRCEQNNPLSGGGECTVPTTVRMSLYPWGGSYSSSLNNDVIIYDDYIIESEKVDSNYKWIPFFWNDLAPGEYVFSLQTLNGPHDGTFSIHHDSTGSQKYSAWLNGYDHYNFICDIFGLDTDMTYERVITNDDSFGLEYGIYNGNSKIKTITQGEYKDTPHFTKNYNSVTMKTCYLSTGGDNLSFEDPGLDGWDVIEIVSTTVDRSEDSFTIFPTDGVASAKFYIPLYSTNYVQLYKQFIFTNCTSLHDLDFDYYIPSGSTTPGYDSLLFQVYISGDKKIHEYIGANSGLFTANIPDLPHSFWLSFRVYGWYDVEPRNVYIDNIRFTTDDHVVAPVGRMVGGSVVKTDV